MKATTDLFAQFKREGADLARAYAERIRRVEPDWTSEQILAKCFEQATSRASLLNIDGASFVSMIEDVARTQGFAEWVQDHRFTDL